MDLKRVAWLLCLMFASCVSPKPVAPKQICFVCTGNYYRSRFAEEYFNHEAERCGLAWHAESRGTGVGATNTWPTPMSPLAVEQLGLRGIKPKASDRVPQALSSNDVAAFDLFVAINKSEHEKSLKQLGIADERIVAWDIQDISGGPPQQEIPRLATDIDKLLEALKESVGRK